MSMTLPIQVKTHASPQLFSFLDATPADPGIRERVCSGILNNNADLSVVLVRLFRSEVKEEVAWFDTKKTKVKTKAGNLNEEEITILEVQYKDTRLTDVDSRWSSVRKKMKIHFLCR